mgnify:CR=1 FL=1
MAKRPLQMESVQSNIGAGKQPSIILPTVAVHPIDLLNDTIDRVCIAHIALSPDSATWRGIEEETAIWASVSCILRDLKRLRDHLLPQL